MKKFISVVLSVVILMSMMVTGLTVGAASTDKATINGKEVSVGSKVTYKIDLKTASKIESVQGVLNFDSNVLKLDSFTMPNTTSNYLTNTNIAGEVHYSAYSIDGDFDFSSQKNYITAEFTVIKADTSSITHNYEVLDDANSKTLLNSNNKPNSSVQETITTTAGEVVPSDTAIINGVKCKVGSTVTFNVWVKAPRLAEDYQGRVFYSNDLLDPQSVTCKANKTAALYKLHDTSTHPGQDIVSYSWVDVMNPVDFTTEDKMVSVVFKVTASGTGTIESSIECLDDTNSDAMISYGTIYDGVTVRTEVIPSEVPPETSTSSTTTSTTQPQPTKTTFNGKEVNVGDEVTVTYMVQADKLCEDFQGYFNYGNKTTGDTTGIELTSCNLKNMPGTILNTDPVGQAVFTGSSFDNPYDFRTKTQFISATFKVTKANCAYYAEAEMYILSAVDGTDYVNQGVVKNPFTWEGSTSTEPTTTSSTTTPSGDYAIINGVKCKVGSTITYNLYLKTPKLVEDYQGYLLYSNDLLKATSIKCKESTSSAYTSLDNTGHYPGRSVVAFNWLNIVDHLDFSNEDVLVSVEFKVNAAGTGYINHDIVAVDDPDANYLIQDNKIVAPDTSMRDEVIAEEEPTTTSTSTTTATTAPRPTKTTFNGKDVKVGDEVTVTYYIQTEKLCEDFQGYFYYGNKTTSDTTGIELKSFYIREDLPGLMCNTAPKGKIVFTGVSPLNPYDFRTKGKFISATFKVNEANYDYYANAVFDVLSAVDGTNYVNFGKIENPFVWEQDTETPKPTTTSSSTSTTTSTTSTTTSTTTSSTTATTGTTAPKTYAVNTILTHVSSTNTAKTAVAGSTYNTIITPEEGYEIKSIVATVGGKNIDAVKSGDSYIINTTVTGDINIVATAEKKAVPSSPTVTSTSSTTSTTATSTTKPIEKVKVRYNLTNVVSSNKVEEIEKNDVYTTVLSPVKGYEISTVVVVVNGSVVPVNKNSDGTYLVSVPATSDITISAYANEIVIPPTTTSSTTVTSTSSSSTTSTSATTATSTTKPPVTTYKVTNNLTNVVTNNSATSIEKGKVYTALLSPVKGYEISTVVLIVNNEVVPVSKNADGTYLISVPATGDITVSAYANLIPPTPTTTSSSTTSTTTSSTSTTTVPPRTTFKVTNNLTNVVTNNNATTVNKNEVYTAVLSPVKGYEISTVVVVSNGEIVPVNKNTDGTYLISVVASGDITISAYASLIPPTPTTTSSTTSTTTSTSATSTSSVPKTFAVNAMLTNAVSTNNAKTVEEGSMYSAIIAPNEGYEMVTFVATMNGQQIEPVKSGNAYIITAKVTGDINIVAYAEKKAEPTTTSSSTTATSATTTSSSTTATTSPVPTSEPTPTTKPGQVIEINKMTLNKATVTVKEGEKFNLVASIWPGYTTEKTVTWSVTNSRVGVVSQTTNTVTGLFDSEGKQYCTETATFTAKASGQVVVKAVSNTGLVAKCVVNVKTVATSISVSKSSVTLNAGKSTTVKATVGPNNIPAQYKGVNWTTSNKKIATVSSNGVIKGISKGTCYVTATSKDNTSLKKTIKVTVKQPVTSVKFNKTSVKLAKKGASTTLKATVAPSNANVKKLTIKSENTKFVKVSKSSVNSGATFKVTAVKKGTTYVRATATDGSKKFARIKVIVQK